MEGPRLGRRRLLAGLGSATVAAAAGCGSGEAPTRLAGTPSRRAGPGGRDETALRRKIASLLVVGFRGQRASEADWVVKAIREGLGGVILFDRDLRTDTVRNISSPGQVTALVKALKQASPGRLLVTIDQEGGRVARLNPGNGFPASRSQAEIGRADSIPTTRAWAEGLTRSLSSIGANFNYAPVVDLNLRPDGPAVGALDRSFSANPDVVVRNATEEVRVHRAAGIRTSLKHFPGLGSASGNTDFTAVDVTDSWRETELEPFRKMIANGATDSILVGHVINRKLDPDRPASLSRAVVTDLLRDRLGWRGPVVSDDIQAVAVTSRFGRDEAVALALTAGVDLLVFGNQQEYDPNVVGQTLDNVVGLVRSGRLTEQRIDQAVARVDTLRPTG
ncbi:glycoside hydrolase family 3 N-terminal domain-containing protein [Plantactinospora sp. WMMB782]|uniref:glycoside hydrolase family 3 N-terminal domain-containing protein n=1 Tax=Plantactinospora sp. WMMB782 TaxID=3404121 RepID=UPI003B92FC97